MFRSLNRCHVGLLGLVADNYGYPGDKNSVIIRKGGPGYITARAYFILLLHHAVPVSMMYTIAQIAGGFFIRLRKGHVSIKPKDYTYSHSGAGSSRWHKAGALFSAGNLTNTRIKGWTLAMVGVLRELGGQFTPVGSNLSVGLERRRWWGWQTGTWMARFITTRTSGSQTSPG